MSEPGPAPHEARAARADDIAAVAALSPQLGAVDPATIAERLALLLASPAHAVFVVECDGVVRGYVVAEHRLLLQFGERVELIALVVDAAQRRHGLGQALVAAVEHWARRRGLTQMVVRSSTRRDAAHPFYRSLGYLHHKTQHVYTRTLP